MEHTELALSTELPPEAATAISTARRPAGFWIRAGASLIDTCVLFAPFFVIGFVYGFMHSIAQEEPSDTALNLISIAAAWLYYALMTSSRWRASVGKRLLGLEVLTLQGEQISFGRASGRHFAGFLSAITLGVGYLMVAFRDDKRALHDLVAGTQVVHSTPK